MRKAEKKAAMKAVYSVGQLETGSAVQKAVAMVAWMVVP